MADEKDTKNDELTEQISTLASQLTAQTASVCDLTEQIKADRKPEAAPAPDNTVFDPENLQKVAQEKGIGHAIIQPLAAAANLVAGREDARAAKAERKAAMRDPDLTFEDDKGNKQSLFKRFEKQVDAYIKEHNVPTSQLADGGYEDIVRTVAARDTAFQSEQDGLKAAAAIASFKESDEYKGEKSTTPKPVGTGVTPTEGVHTGVVTAPAKKEPGEDEKIAAIEVSDLDLRRGEYFNMTKEDIQKERFKTQKIVEKMDPLEVAIGIPICEWSELKRDKQGNPVEVE
jgi:hypothetical protein